MKMLKFMFVALLGVGLMTALPSCKKDDDTKATCTDGVQNGNETGVDCGGDCAPCPTCTDGIQNGNETGVDCGGDCPPCEVGVHGSWWSKGADVAPLLVNFFDIDSIYAEFRTNQTYEVVTYSGGVASTLTGVFTQSDSGVNGIWDIVVIQNTPAALTSTGIFKVDGDNMQYEVVQTDPSIGAVPPTATLGFGSTNGGGLGMQNVQKYVRAN